MSLDTQTACTGVDMEDKAGTQYWDHVWAGKGLPSPVRLGKLTWRNRYELAYHNVFKDLFSSNVVSGRRLLEAGAARSKWLPYFAEQYGLDVVGIDYSTTGCEQARQLLDRAGVSGEVVDADFDNPPPALLGAFDYVVSFGVVEHFTDTVQIVDSLAKFLAPGGTMLTTIPNLTGVAGPVQRQVCRDIYDVHVPLDARQLKVAHSQAGLDVVSCKYLMSGGFTNVNPSCHESSRFYPAVLAAWAAASLPFFCIDKLHISLPPTKLLSPYIICIAKKSGSTFPSTE